jgi:hypothetical protein
MSDHIVLNFFDTAGDDLPQQLPRPLRGGEPSGLQGNTAAHWGKSYTYLIWVIGIVSQTKRFPN